MVHGEEGRPRWATFPRLGRVHQPRQQQHFPRCLSGGILGNGQGLSSIKRDAWQPAQLRPREGHGHSQLSTEGRGQGPLILPASVPNTLSPAKGPSLVAVVTTSLGASPSHSSLRNSARRSPLSPEHAAREAAVRVLSTLSASATERESQAVLPALLRGGCGKARSRAACRKDGRQRSGCSRHSRRRTRPGRAHIWMASAGSGRVSAATLAICHSQYVRLF